MTFTENEIRCLKTESRFEIYDKYNKSIKIKIFSQCVPLNKCIHFICICKYIKSICVFQQMHLFFNTFMTNAFILYVFATKSNQFVHLNKSI